jgi:nucleotide-binding universal stress UspA family protein
VLGSCATGADAAAGADAADGEESFAGVETVVIAGFEFRSTVASASEEAPLDPEVADLLKERLAARLEESGRQVIMLSDEETGVLIPEQVDEMAARLGGDVVVRGTVRLAESRLDYLVEVSSTVARAAPQPTPVTVSAQEGYTRGRLEAETVVTGVGATVIGQVIGLLAPR